MNEGAIPQEALEDPNSVEMIRVWVAQKSLFCSLRIGMYDERGISETKAWGIILADVLRHVSEALQKRWDRNMDPSDMILKSMMEELEKRTSKTSGKFIDPI